jgi:hypothetical protein
MFGSLAFHLSQRPTQNNTLDLIRYPQCHI